MTTSMMRNPTKYPEKATSGIKSSAIIWLTATTEPASL